MKWPSFILVLVFLICIDVSPLHAQGRLKVVRHADDVLPLLPILFALFHKLGGVSAVVAAALYARPKNNEIRNIAALVAFAGGAWTAFAWFGWPFIAETRQGFLGPIETSSFSFLRLVGVGALGFLGVVAFDSLVSNRKPTDSH